MPIIDIQITDVKRVKDNIAFKAVSGNNVIERTLNFNDIDNWTDFADWLINQSTDYVLVPNKEKSLSITFHTETDSEGNVIRIVDNVAVS